MLNPHVFDPIAVKNFTCALITHFYSFAIAWKWTRFSCGWVWLQRSKTLSYDRFFILFHFHFCSLWSFCVHFHLFISLYITLIVCFCYFLSLSSLLIFLYTNVYILGGEWIETYTHTHTKKNQTHEINTFSSFVRWRLCAGHFKSITLLFFFLSLSIFQCCVWYSF